MSLIITLIVLGLLLYLINLIPLDATIHQLIRVVIIIVAVVYVIQFLLGAAYLPTFGPLR